MKLRRFNDSRVEPNIPLILIAEAGGWSPNKDTDDVHYNQGVDNKNTGWIEIRKLKDGMRKNSSNTHDEKYWFVKINRALQITSNLEDFDKPKAKEKLLEFKDHIELEYEI